MPGKHPNRGLALIAVIATLVALVLVALPFAIQMGNAARRAEQRLFPVRHPDRYVFEGSHPQASALVLREEVTGALMKRLSWDENLPEGTELEVYARFDGTPDWDSDKVYDVSAKKPDDGDEKAFEKSPKSYLFRFDDPHGENRLMIQADRIEIRFAFRYAGGAFQWDADDPPDGWKASPWVKAVRVESLAPSSVRYTEPR